MSREETREKSRENAYHALLDAENAEVVHALLDDAVRAACARTRDGGKGLLDGRCEALAEKRRREAREALRLERAEDRKVVDALLEALDGLVRRAVMDAGIASIRGSGGGEGDGEGANGAALVKSTARAREIVKEVEHEALEELLAVRIVHRCGKWREKLARAAEMPYDTLEAFDWVVRVTSSARAGEDVGRATCRAAARITRRGETRADGTVATRDVHFEITRDSLRDITASLSAAKAAIRRALPDAEEAPT